MNSTNELKVNNRWIRDDDTEWSVSKSHRKKYRQQKKRNEDVFVENKPKPEPKPDFTKKNDVNFPSVSNKDKVTVEKENDKEWVKNCKIKFLFRNAKHKKNKLKPGWVRLTKHGIIDSLTDKENEEIQNEMIEKRKYEAMLNIEQRRRQHRNNLYERDGYLSTSSLSDYDDDEESLDNFSSSEEEIDTEEEAEQLDEENYIYEENSSKKWI